MSPWGMPSAAGSGDIHGQLREQVNIRQQCAMSCAVHSPWCMT
uniref:Uncharacterized protein n=1 Tax=Nymphaea colorata TaxID=210225 RepID=A0A5K0VBH3_9MAGN